MDPIRETSFVGQNRKENAIINNMDKKISFREKIEKTVQSPERMDELKNNNGLVKAAKDLLEEYSATSIEYISEEVLMNKISEHLDADENAAGRCEPHELVALCQYLEEFGNN